MDKRLFLCVDGGGTKTEALLLDTFGSALGRGTDSGSNALSVGKNQAVCAVMTAVDAALGQTPVTDICALHLFIPGFSACLPLPLDVKTYLHSDSVNAYFGALAKPGGIAILAGTGSFAVSFDENGRETSVGGWGSMLGDEGSGYDIGKRAVIHTLSVRDAGMLQTVLGQSILAHYGAESDRLLLRAIYQGGCDRSKMAALCKVVSALAHQGDADALRILSEAAEELCELSVRLKKRLQLQTAPVALLGGVAGIGEPILKPLQEALQKENLILQEPRFGPAVGGALYAYREITGTLPSDTLAQAYNESYLKLIKEQESIC